MLDFSFKHWKIGVMAVNKIPTSQGSTVSIVTDYGLENLGVGVQEFSLPYCV
jgi:hypothetical protein